MIAFLYFKNKDRTINLPKSLGWSNVLLSFIHACHILENVSCSMKDDHTIVEGPWKLITSYACISFMYFVLHHGLILTFFSFCLWHSGSKQARRVVYSVLCNACENGDLTVSEAVAAIKGIFKDNAWNFYNLKDKISPINLRSSPSSSVISECRQSSDDVTFVRIIWVDTSAQHRCRVSSLTENFLHFLMFYFSVTNFNLLTLSEVHFFFLS